MIRTDSTFISPNLYPLPRLRYNAAIVEYGQRAGVPVIDDRTSIPPDAEHFTDCMHLADKGNEAMAERFYRFFRTSGIVPGTP